MAQALETKRLICKNVYWEGYDGYTMYVCMYACADYDWLIMYKCTNFCEINIQNCRQESDFQFVTYCLFEVPALVDCKCVCLGYDRDNVDFVM